MNDSQLTAKCGLYCGACTKFLKEKCPGCAKNQKATWCKIRTCCDENAFKSCAECTIYYNAMQCNKFNNLVSKFFMIVFRSDRMACLNMIQKNGYNYFEKYMSRNKIMTIRKK